MTAFGKEHVCSIGRSSLAKEFAWSLRGGFFLTHRLVNSHNYSATCVQPATSAAPQVDGLQQDFNRQPVLPVSSAHGL